MSVVGEQFWGCSFFNAEGKIKGKELPKAPRNPFSELYTFHEEDTKENILFAPDTGDIHPTIKGGTLEKLIERLTYEKYVDPNYVKAFLLTYRTFTTPAKLLKILLSRFHTTPKQDVKDIDVWNITALKTIRIRVHNVLKNWLTHGFYDFEDNSVLCMNLVTFIDEDLTEYFENGALSLRKIFDRKLNKNKIKEIELSGLHPPKPILPKSMLTRNLRFVDINPEEIARQLTILEANLYRKIKPWEFLDQAWTKKDKEKRAPRVIRMINRFNTVSNLVVVEILETKSLKGRIAILRHLIEVASKCMALNNFNGVMEIISGLQANAIFRLSQSWEGIGSKHFKMYEECQASVSHQQNFKQLRQCLHTADPPCIPYLGMYLTDLTFISDGNSNTLPGGLINFVKRSQMASVIAEIQQYQQTPYALESVPFLQEWIRKKKIISTETEQYELSVLLEQKTKGKGGKGSKSKKQDPNMYSKTYSIYGELEDIPGYLFYEPDTPQNLTTVESKFENHVTVVAGTFPKLVERLTYEKYPNASFVHAFLMTYKTFTDPNTLLDLLIMRYHLPKPINPSKEQMKSFVSEKQIPIRFRVFNILKLWTDLYFGDFLVDTLLIQRILDFTTFVTETDPVLRIPSSSCRQAFTKKLESTTTTQKEDDQLFFEIGSGGTTFPEDDFNPISWNILEFDVRDIGLQIYCNTYRIFSSLNCRECLHPSWRNRHGKIFAPHLYLMHANSQALYSWIKTEILYSKDIRVRVATTGFFIEMANLFLQLKDFHDCFIVLKVMEFFKQKKYALIWDWLEEEHLAMWERIKDTNPRAAVKENMQGRSTDIMPQIPYYEPELNQFYDILTHSPDNLSESVINFEKRINMYNTFSSLRDAQKICQQNKNKNPTNQPIIEFLTSIPILSDQQLNYAADHVNNLPPEGISPAEQQRQRKAAKQLEKSRIRLHDATFDVIQDTGFKYFTNALLVQEILPEIINPIKSSLHRFTILSRALMNITTARGNESFSSRRIIEQNKIVIANTVFPKADRVYPDPHNEKNHSVIVTTDKESILIDAYYSIDIPLLKQIQDIQGKLGKEESKRQKLFLVCCVISSSAKEIAANRGDIIEIL